MVHIFPAGPSKPEGLTVFVSYYGSLGLESGVHPPSKPWSKSHGLPAPVRWSKTEMPQDLSADLRCFQCNLRNKQWFNGVSWCFNKCGTRWKWVKYILKYAEMGLFTQPHLGTKETQREIIALQCQLVFKRNLWFFPSVFGRKVDTGRQEQQTPNLL